MLESLLRDKRLDRTLTTTLPPGPARPADRLVTTGLAALDTALDGGVPRGQISELAGALSTGRTALMHRLLAKTTRQGELAAVIDVLDQFDPATAAAQGVVLDRLLWVRGETNEAVARSIKALNLVVSAGGFGLVVFDAGGVPARALRQLPFTTWLRVHRVLEGSDTACVLLADLPLARSVGGASVRLGGASATDTTAVRVASVTSDFHARVRASRYLDPSVHDISRAESPVPARCRQPPGRWIGSGPHARRFEGITVHADVQYALRNAACRMTATESGRLPG